MTSLTAYSHTKHFREISVNDYYQDSNVAKKIDNKASKSFNRVMQPDCKRIKQNEYHSLPRLKRVKNIEK